MIGFAGKISAQKLIINEVSNGPSGNKEYVELVVVDTTVVYSCNGITTPPCIDIRGWIFDDNSGYHGGSGIAPGCMRFSNDAMWSCVPVGTIILIYYGSDRNGAIPPDDVSLTDGNCRIIAPDYNTTLFDKNSTTPGANACSYPPSGWSAGGNWNNTVLANPGDCARIVNLSGCEVFSVCWGSDNQNNLIYFSGAGGQRNWYFNSGDPNMQANWSQGNAPGNETPGSANNAANLAYINQFNNGCNPITPLSVTNGSANAGCTCTGSASVTPSGSIGPYTYHWSNGATTAAVNGLCAGIYTVQVESAIHCTQTLSFTITAAGVPDANAGTTQAISCANPTVTLNGSSATPGVTYGWTGPGIVSGGSTTTPSVNAPGTYTLTVTSGTCTATSTVSVTSASTPPNISIAAPAQLTCTTATVTLTGSSTIPGVTYQWTSGPATSGNAVTTAGVYTLTVTNPANGCTSTATTTVTSNTTLPNATIAAPPPLSCTTTTVTLAGSSTTPGATFQWTSGPATANYPVTVAGTYTLTTTNPANGCTNTATVAVTNTAIVPDASIAAPVQLTCTTTTLSLNGSSTTPGVSYGWTGAGIVSGGSTSTPVVNAAGIYTLTVTDAGTCTNTATVSVTSNTTAPNVSIAAPAQLTCVTTTVTLTGSSTTPGVTYQWTAGPATANYPVTTAGTFTLTATNPTNGCINTTTAIVTSNTTIPTISIAAPAQLTCATTTVTLAGSSTTPGVTYQWTTGPATTNYPVNTSGIYTLTVTNPVNGCTATATTTVTSNTSMPNVNVAPPAQLTCTTTTITLAASSTTPGVTYQWTSGPATANYAVSTAGTYIVSVIDPLNGCTASSTVTLISNTAVPDAAIATPAQLTCSTIIVTLTGSSSTPGVTYQWTGGPATANYSATSAGTYTLTTTNPANGCTNTATVGVISNTTAPTISIAAPSQITCVTSTVAITGSSTTPGVSYQWSGGPATAGYTVSSAGTYTLIVTDPSNGCWNAAGVTVTSNTITPDINIAAPQTLTCVNLSSTLSGSSATIGVSYQWTSGPSTATHTVAAAGTYTLTVTNPANGCVNSATTTVSSNTTIPDVSIASPASLNCVTTTVTLTGSSSTPGVSYQWTSGPATANYDVSTAGTYSLIVTDPVNGCTAPATVTVINTGIFPDASIAAPGTITCSNSFVTLTGSSTTAGVAYQWTSGPASPVHTVNAGGTYTLTVTDLTNMCSSFAFVTVVSDVVLPDVSITPPAQLTCVTSNVTLAGFSSIAGVTYQWSGGPFNANYTVSTVGTYSLTVTNPANGCTNIADATVSSNASIPDVSIAAPGIITCAQPSVVLTGSSSVSGLNYQWTGGSAASTHTVSASGSYTLAVTDPSNGCVNTASVTVLSNTIPPIAVFTPAGTTGCAPVCVSLVPDLAANPLWQYTWTFSDGTVIDGYNGDACFTQAGLYGAVLTVTSSDNGCSANSSVSDFIEAYPVPDAAFSYSPLFPTTYDPLVVFTNESTSGSTYIWTFDGDSTLVTEHPRWSFDEEGNHMVTLLVQNSFGCTDSIGTTILVEGEFAVYVPNCFTPNTDEYNPTWRPVGVGVDETDYEMSIYNRWGTRIFNTTDWEHGAWDGKLNGTLVEIGTYIYKIKVSPKIKNNLDAPKELNGHLHVIR
jgi:gliding motility-associated-like protein